MDEAATFGQWLRRRRRRLDLTQAELARRAGCSEITIRKIEADERMPSRQVAALLAACLELADHEREAFVAFARGRRTDLATIDSRSLATAPAPAGRLPLPLTRLLGRQDDVALIRQYLGQSNTRLLTLVGPPGIGKTRLALEVAADLSRDDGAGSQFPDGVVFVPLAALNDAGLVLDAIAQALQVAESAGQTLLEQLASTVRGQCLLLVLDNFEHLLPAGPQVARLLMACPDIKVLATSRAALHIRGEQLFPVAPLALPDLAWPISTTAVAQSPAVMLFVERAQAVAPRFALGAENAATVAAICARLDGLPLAIELVAASSRLLPPLALLSRLGQRLSLPVTGPGDLPPRQQTLHSAIAWSYGLLGPAEQRLYQRLGVFVGDYELEAIAAICATDRDPDQLTPSSVLDALEALIDHSLVTHSVSGAGEPRFGMLETIREYALQRLTESGQLAALHERHAQYYLSLARQAEAQLSGALQDSWLDRLEREHDHFRTALAWCLAGTATPEQGAQRRANATPARAAARLPLGLSLGAALWRFWYTRCHLSEGRRWLGTLLAAGDGGDPGARVRVLLGDGILSNAQGDTEQARRLLEACLAEARRHDDQEGVALANYHLGTIIFGQGEVVPAIDALEQCLTIQRARGDTAGIATALNGLGNLLIGGDDARAVVLLEESVALQRRLGNTRGIAFSLHSLGYACLCQDRPADALPHLNEALLLFVQLGDKIGIADCLAGLAAVAGGLQQRERAARLWQAAEQLRESIGAPLSAAERADYQRYLDQQVAGATLATHEDDDAAIASAIAEARALVDDFQL